MKVLKKFLCILLAASLLTMTACSSTEKNTENNIIQTDEEINKGRYIETDITPEDITDSFMIYLGKRSDGSIDTIFSVASPEGVARPSYKHFNSKDEGESWDELATDFVTGIESSHIQEIAVADDGTIYAIVVEYDDNGIPDQPEGGEPPMTDGEYLAAEASDSELETASAEGEIAAADETVPVEDETETADTDESADEQDEDVPVMMELRLSDMSVYKIPTNGIAEKMVVDDIDSIDIENNRVYFDEFSVIGNDRLFVIWTEQPLAVNSSSETNYGPNPNFNSLIDLSTGSKLGEFKENAPSSGDESGFMQDHYIYCSDEEMVIRFGANSRIFSGINVSDGSEVTDKVPQIEGNNYFSHFAFDEDGNLYTMDYDFNVSRIASGGSLVEKVIDGTEFVSSGSDVRLDSFVVADGILYVGLWGVNSSILKMEYDPEAISDPAKKLTIYSLYPSESLRNSIAEMRKENPDISIKVESPEFTHEKSSYETEIEDALRTLNTELLAGKGPDIIILDNMPFESYIDKGILADISSVIENEDDYVSSVINTFKSDEGLFVVPTNFQVPVLIGGEEVENIKTLDDLVEAVKQNAVPKEIDYQNSDSMNDSSLPEEERPFLYVLSHDELFSYLFPSSAPAILENGSINKENLKIFLSEVKEIYDHNEINKIPAENEEMYAGAGYSNSYMMENGKTISVSYGSLLSHFTRGEAKAALDNYASDAIAMILYRIEEPVHSVNQPGLSNGVYVPTNLVGVVESSTKKELAMDFVKHMLSEKAQDYFVYEGSPVLKASIDNQKEVFEGFFEEYFEEYQDSLEEYKIQDIDFGYLFDTLDTPYMKNDVITMQISEISKSHCKGEITIDEAVDKIMRETEIYFAEKS